jgi:3-keto-disaccharide hydrolase
MQFNLATPVLLPALLTVLGGSALWMQGVGYDDTPMLPDSQWRVHDSKRVPPPVVTPGVNGAAPSDATQLFGGGDLSAWSGGPWKLEGDFMEVNGSGQISTKQSFGDCQLHVEWASPSEVVSESQGRGNSGIFLMGRYEVQVLDSYDNVTYADGQAGSLYGQTPPLFNACRKPGEWQSYDIVFEAPEFEGDKLVEPAYVTLIHNGVLVHHRKAYIGGTTHKAVAKYSPHGPAPIRLQDHGNPVRYRNIWIRPLGEYDVQ